MNPQGQYGGAPRRPNNAYGQPSSDELHIPSNPMNHGASSQMSPRDFTTAPGPQIKLEQPPSQPTHPSQYQPSSSSAVPGVLQPGRHSGMGTNPGPPMSSMSGSMQQSPSEYASPSKPPSLSMSHTYTRGSPADPYDTTTPSSYTPYTPTTPGGSAIPGQSQYMSPNDPKYTAPGSHRSISNTPLGLADIRPRADSSLSDSQPGTMGYELANSQPSTSNYLAPWALYAFDWCKWKPHGKGTGKVAVGSYLEDGHNFVCLISLLTSESSVIVISWTPVANTFHVRYKFLIHISSTRPLTSIRLVHRNNASNSPRLPRRHIRTPSRVCYGNLHRHKNNQQIY